MTTRVDIVAEARSWLDVPFHHQGRTRAGCDCGGLVGGVAVALGVVPQTWWAESFDPLFGGYARTPAGGVLQRVCESFMTTIDIGAAGPGDVLLMRFKTEPQHLGILADYVHGGLSIVHALSRAGKVAEHRMAPEWWARVVAVYRMPGVA